MNLLESKIFEIKDESQFEEIALEVFHFQYNNNLVYRDYVLALKKKMPTSIIEIPFLPISFFKSHKVKTEGLPECFEFLSSGTTGMERSRHIVQKPEMYKNSFSRLYEYFIGSPKDQVILALLPNYLEQGNSSLIYMVDSLIQQSDNPLSGFFLDDYGALLRHYKLAVQEGKKVILFGVSYALLDLAERKVDLSSTLIIETGGMKGRRKELTKAELHEKLTEGLNCKNIGSEYGMTELFSQSYSINDGIFEMSSWMKILVRETNDPFHYVEDGKTGGINVIDLANLYSCSFIETQDLGKRMGNKFQLMGRFDHSDIRGCNLMVE